MLTDVVVVVFNPDMVALDCLNSLNEHNAGLGRIILIDNASRDKTNVIRLAGLADVHVTLRVQASLAGAWNTGISYSNTPYVVISNDDIIFTRDWLPPLQEAFGADRHLGVVQPYNTLAGLPVGFPNNYEREDRVGDTPRDNFVGCCFAVNKKIYPALKLFDSSRWPDDLDYTYFYEKYYPFGAEDQDFYERVRRAGFKTQTHFGSYVHHFTGKTMSQLEDFHDVKARSNELFAERWNGMQMREEVPKP